MSDDIRSAVASSYESVAGASEAPAVTEAPAPEPVEAAPEAPDTAPSESVAPTEGSTPAVTPGAPKPGQPQANAATGAQPEATAAAPKSEYKPPQSWKPAVREHWGKLPSEVQAEVVRRESEVQRLVQETSEHRRVAQAFEQTLAPYMGFIQAKRQDPVQAVAGLLQTAAALRTAPPAHKAALVAQIVHGYGIPVDMLDAALAGQLPQQTQQQAPQQLDPNQIVAQAEQRITQRLQQQAQQLQMRKAQSDLEAFVSSGEAEFLDDVRPIMSSLLAAAAQSGIALSLKDAYNQAVAMSPDLKPVLQQREQAQKATATQAATQRAKNAAASVRSVPAPTAVAAPRDLRGDLEAAIARASGR